MSLNQKDFQVVPEKPLIEGGFTLLELMITVSLAAILVALAVPSFNDTIKNNRLTTQVNEFVTSLYVARSEAVKRGQRVTMCKSSDGNTCVTTGDWSQGWIIFTDPNNSATYDFPGETLLKVQVNKQAQITMVGNGSIFSYISYVSTGQTAKITGAFQSGTVKVCDDRIGAFGKSIVFNNIGRSKINTGISC